MGTDVERTDGKMPNNADDDLRSLEEAYSDLREETQQLINERTSLEAEMRTLRKKIERLEENVNLLKMPPLIVGHIQDILDHERAIVRWDWEGWRQLIVFLVAVVVSDDSS